MKKVLNNILPPLIAFFLLGFFEFDTINPMEWNKSNWLSLLFVYAMILILRDLDIEISIKNKSDEKL